MNIGNENKEEIDNEENEKDDNSFPENSVLIKDDFPKSDQKEEEEEIFKSQIFLDLIKSNKKLVQEKKDKILKSKLKTLMTCGSCKKNLKDLLFCPFCKKISCNNCFNKQYYYLNKDHTPCPLCKKMVKRSKLKKITLLEIIAEVIEEKEEDNSKVPLIKLNPVELISNCDNHKLNKIFAYCIDCDKKMCAVCYNHNENEHKKHRCINYEIYLDLNIFFGNSFKNIKNFILISDKTIRDLQKLNSDLENHRAALLDFTSKLFEKVNSIFQEGKDKINGIIIDLTQKISQLNNFRKNIKKYVTKSIPIGYSEFDDIEEIKNKINERIKKIEINLPNYEFTDIEKKYKKNISIEKLEEIININKERIKKGIHLNVQSNENYKFNIEISVDKEEVFFYLDINKNIEGKEKINSYLVEVVLSDLNQKTRSIYLEFDKDKEDNSIMTYINSISRKDLFNNYNKGMIYLKIHYLNIE